LLRLLLLFMDGLVWDSNRWIILATRDEDAFVFSDRRGGIGGGGRSDSGSISEINDCEGRNVIVYVLEFDDDDDDDDWRKNDVNWLLLLLFVLKSVTDVHRWVNVDEDIFLSLSYNPNESLTTLSNIINYDDVDDNNNNNNNRILPKRKSTWDTVHV
jgi:hypothetical protein